MTSIASITERRHQIELRIKQAEGAVMVVKAELKALQHECSHPGVMTTYGRDYDGGGNSHFKCNLCGLERST